MNGQDENSTGQDSSKLLDLFGKLSLSKTIDKDDTVKDSKVNVSTLSSQSQTSASPSASTDQVNPSPVIETVRKDQEKIKSNGEKARADYSHVVWNNVSFKTPYPDDPIIDLMVLKDCNLDKSFSTETSSLTAPKRLGYFSCHINADGKTQSYHPDKSSVRYLAYHPRNKLNLLDGFSESVNWGRVPPGEMHLLRWFSENSFELTNEDGSSTVDFICYSRMLRSMMAAPYNSRDDWTGIAIKVRGSIIIDEIDTPQRQATTEGQSYHQKASSYAGYKFEELITRGYDGFKKPSYAEGNRDSFYIVSRAKLNNHTILYTNRVDCAQNKHQLYENVDMMKVAQIKTRISSSRFPSKFFWQHRAITWWIESWLGNIDLIICGEKTSDFQIERMTRMWVNRLPNERNRWSPRTCVSFLDLVLTFIKTMVTDELTPYRFYYDPGRVIVCQKINEPVEKYLPSWFINNQEPDDD